MPTHEPIRLPESKADAEFIALHDAIAYERWWLVPAHITNQKPTGVTANELRMVSHAADKTAS